MRTRSHRLTLLALALTGAIAALVAVHRRAAPPPHEPDATSSIAGLPAASAFHGTAAEPSLPAEPSRPLAPSLDAILGPLARVSDGDLQEASSDAYLALLKALRADAGLVGPIETWLATAAADDPGTRVAIGALAGLGTSEAQAALARLTATRTGDVDLLEVLLPTMSFVRSPDERLEAAVRAAADDGRERVRSSGRLAVGIVAAGVDRSDPARSARIVADYGTRLGTTGDADEARGYLALLGNAHTAAAAQVVAAYVDDPRPLVRAAAMKALRLVPTEAARATLLRALVEDPDPDVRARAAWALSYQRASAALLQAEIAALEGETTDAVAREVLSALWQGRAADPATVTAAVTRFAQGHPLASIQSQARDLLAQPG